MNTVRRLLHFTILLIGAIPWVAAYWLMVFVVWMANLADWVWPNATHGNCFTFALPKWRKHGGYLTLRESPQARVFGVFPVIHAIWQHNMPRSTRLRMVEPTRRKRFRWLPIEVFYFEYQVTDRERSRDATGVD